MSIEQELVVGYLRTGKAGIDDTVPPSLILPACDAVSVAIDTKLHSRTSEIRLRGISRCDHVFLDYPQASWQITATGGAILCYRN